MTAASLLIRADGREVEVSRPDKQLFPSGITKAEMAWYYGTIAWAMVPHLAGRPLNLERYPDGIDGPRIIQQRAGTHFPAWIKRVTVPKRGGTVDHVVASDAATLVYLAGQACITLHAWLSRADRLTRPDRLVFDLDPGVETVADVRDAARELGELLRELGLEPFAMTTGSRGYHVTVALHRRSDFDAVRSFARDVAWVAVTRDPRLTLEQRKAARGGRILVDIMRNAYGQTAVVPYSLRARPDAPVATPLHWHELSEPGTRPDRWTLRTIPDRLERGGDPWADIQAAARTLGAPRRRLEQLLRDLRANGHVAESAASKERLVGRRSAP
jgi:bifunctional non-homologous end joining protein LigD